MRRSGQVVVAWKPEGMGPTSVMISRWHDQTRRIASGVPMPAARGSPAGPNQWFCGAPVVRARMPAYVVPFTVFASTCRNASFLEGLGFTYTHTITSTVKTLDM